MLDRHDVILDSRNAMLILNNIKLNQNETVLIRNDDGLNSGRLEPNWNGVVLIGNGIGADLHTGKFRITQELFSTIKNV